jgi:tetratricopeptide (TPR) repeat protein
VKYRTAIKRIEAVIFLLLPFLVARAANWPVVDLRPARAMEKDRCGRQSEKHFDFNPACQEAYQDIIQLKLDAGQNILRAEESRDPDNLVPLFLENYIDFFILFFNEDPAEYASRKGMLDQRIKWMNEGPESSPFYLFTHSVIHFQWAAIKVKFGDNWDAGWEFRRSFLQSKELMQKFPSFVPARMLRGAMEVAAGTIPDGYRWLSSLLGIKGNIKEGMQRLSDVLTADDVSFHWLRNEATFYYLYLKFYIENKHEDVFAYIRTHNLDIKNNYLFSYLAANLAINDQRAAYAEQVIRQRSKEEGYLAMPVWDLEMGYALICHQSPDAHIYLERYVNTFKGRFYVKDALQKLSWYYYLNGNMVQAAQYRTQILSKGGLESDADKQALKEARSGQWPDKVLLKARLLCDGGYYTEALQSLQGKGVGDFHTPEDKCEFAYRLGRIYDGLGRNSDAISAYLSAIRMGENLRPYFAARAALQTGYIYEQQGDKPTAINYFQICLSLKDHDYKNSLDQKAKAGIERCK